MRQLPGWEQTNDAVAKTFVLDSFRSAMLFVERIGDSIEGASQAAGHHPQIDIRSDRVRIAIRRSDATGVTVPTSRSRVTSSDCAASTDTRRVWPVLPESAAGRLAVVARRCFIHSG
jgi:4a-hydroxytetrahydrobiopterin dehydratase